MLRRLGLVLALLGVCVPASAGNPILVGAGMPNTSAGVATAISDESGSGSLLFGTAPTISSPVLTMSHESVTAGVGSPNVLTAAECGKTIDDIGAGALTYNTLPDAPTAGCFFKFVVTTANGIRITANSGDTVQIGALTSAAAGYLQSQDIGAITICEAASATAWLCEYRGGGEWSVDGATRYLGGSRYALTTTLTEAIMTGSGSGQVAHASGTTLAAAVTGKRLALYHAFAAYTFDTAAYTTCNFTIKMSDGTSLINLSEAIGTRYTATANFNDVYTHNDTYASGSGGTLAGRAIVLQGTACVDPGAANGTGAITVYYDILNN
jgi:hypothetical protein